MARAEVTGKKPRPTAERAKLGHNRGPPLDDGPKYRRRPVSADPNSLAMSIKEFCRLHGISEDQFYKMKREGWGPTTMKVGSRTLISHEAAAAWRAEREAAAKEAAAKKAVTAA
jgi:predicted DNA-binding transcriptional regulator AlpA